MTEPLPRVDAVPRLAPAERESVIARLSDAFAHDVLSLDEFEQRTAAVYAATSTAELSALLADLPAAATSVAPRTDAPGAMVNAAPARIAAVFGNVERGGVIEVPPRLEVRAVFGNVELDLSSARFGAGVTEISVRAVCGNVELTLPPDAVVENHGSGTLASFTCHAAPATPGAGAERVHVRVTGRAILANVEILAPSSADVRRALDRGDG